MDSSHKMDCQQKQETLTLPELEMMIHHTMRTIETLEKNPIDYMDITEIKARLAEYEAEAAQLMQDHVKSHGSFQEEMDSYYGEMIW